ncbi:MAG: glucosyl-3-phosphoglycerate synthase, partial [Solirubrobacteraceae bacterium]|nr:glucosyl-3-phosphoglycerate synthase [Solirubrobacteraceae bacterium]
MVRTFHHRQFGPRPASVSVVIPTRECAATIAPIVETVRALGVARQVLVVDADSRDGTADAAAAAGATVVSENVLLPQFGPARGKGDAMWRALSVCSGDIVLYLDGDSGDFGPHFVTGTLGPLLSVPGIEFVKGFYRRPFGDAPEGGGRVTELTARPLLRRFWPDLAGLHQPLAGEIAAPRELLRSIPFATGYAVETAMLLAVRDRVGAGAIAQVDLEVRRNDHQSLTALAAMADEVLGAACAHLGLPGE